MSDREVVLKAATVELSATSGESTQPRLVDEWRTPKDCIEPPESLTALQKLTAISPGRRPSLEAMALNTVGLGYTLSVKTGHEREVEDRAAVIAQATRALERCARRDVVLDAGSLTTLLKAVKYDEEEVGNGAMEVSRDRRTGKIDGLYHVPSIRVRRRKDRSGYLLLPPSGDEAKAVPFYNFGEKVKYNASEQPMNTLLPGRRWAINELIVFRVYTSESRDYGLPRDASLSLDYLADKFAAENNVSFFDSSGTPPTIVFVQGEEKRDGSKLTFAVPASTADAIADTLASDGGRKKRVAVIPVPPGTATKEVKLGETSDRDMGFIQFRADNAARQATSFRLQPIFLSMNTEGRYDAEVQRAITLEQVFDPEQSRYERVMDEILVDLGYPLLTLNFTKLAVESNAQRRESTERGAEVGAVTNREFRDAHGFPPMPEADPSETPIEWRGQEWKSAEPEPGQVPFGWNDSLMSPLGKPEGAENRVNEADDQRGLRPGVGGRTSRDKLEGQPRHVEAQVAQARTAVGGAQRAAAQRAVERVNGAR